MDCIFTEICEGENLIGFSVYELSDDVIAFIHTEIELSFEGAGTRTLNPLYSANSTSYSDALLILTTATVVAFATAFGLGDTSTGGEDDN